MKRKTKRNPMTAYGSLIILTIFFCWFFCGRHGIFGSNVDWISQHSVIPDYFRQQFYDTGQLFPEFAANLGGGQNIYHFSYYGLYSPLILPSYFLPFVKMGTYIMAMSFLSLAASVLLLYTWLLRRGFPENISFPVSVTFLLSGPMIFHSYCQVMFVDYMPFLLLAFLGVDSYFEKRTAGLYTVSVFLMIMTSFYFSIGGMLVLVLYGIYRYIQICEETGGKITFGGFLADGFRFLFPMGTAVLMSGILLVPALFAMAGRDAEKEAVDVLSLFLPNVQIFRFIYSPYGIGLTTFSLTVLIAGFFFPRMSERILVYESVFFLIMPVAAWLLNGGLYIRDKVMIPFLPLLCYLTALYVSKSKKKSAAAEILPYLVTLFLLYIGRNQPEYKEYWIFVLLEAVITAAVFLMARQKQRMELLTILQVIFLALFGTVFHEQAGRIESREFYDQVADEKIGEAVKDILKEEKGFFRMEQAGTAEESKADINRIWDMEQYVSSMYSSFYHGEYLNFRSKSFRSGQPFRNILMQAASENPVWRYFMGVRYLISRDPAAGYKQCLDRKGIHVYRREDVLPIAYVTDSLISEKEYQQLEFPYNQAVFLERAVAVGSKDMDFSEVKETMKKDIASVGFSLSEKQEKGLSVEKTSQGYHICTERTWKTELDLLSTEETISGEKLVFLAFSVKNHQPEQDVSVSLNGQKNKLSGSGHIYNNHNTEFVYGDILEEGQTKAALSFGKGDYEITDIRCYVGKWEEEAVRQKRKTLCQAEFFPDKAKTKGNRIEGNVSVERAGYFVTSIPYDKNFEIRVDGEQKKPEKVNLAFLGFPIKPGKHKILLVYHAPGVGAGKGISLLGWFFFGGIVLRSRMLKRRSVRISRAADHAAD